MICQPPNCLSFKNLATKKETEKEFIATHDNLLYIRAMPFTLSHPAIILPVKKLLGRSVSLTGLIAGAMSPDLIFFLTGTTDFRGISHSWSGLFIFCLPAGILFALAFHWLFKQHFIFNMPSPLDLKLSGLARSLFSPKDLQAWIVLFYSVLIGTLSHFFWDSWTHPEGELSRMLPFLLETWRVFGRDISITSFVHRTSTAIGGIVMISMIWKGWFLPSPVIKEPIRRPAQKIRFWFGGAVIAVIGALVAVRIYAGYWTIDFASFDWEFHIISKLGLGSWAGFFWAVCFYTILKRSLWAKILGSTSKLTKLK